MTDTVTISAPGIEPIKLTAEQFAKAAKAAGGDATAVAAGQLKSIVERVENVEEEIKELNAGKSEIYQEAKANGFDVAVIKRIIAMRRKPAAERAEEDAILELYMQALGMAG